MLSCYNHSSIKKVILLGYEVLELKLVIFENLSIESFKEGNLKLFNKKFFNDL